MKKTISLALSLFILISTLALFSACAPSNTDEKNHDTSINDNTDSNEVTEKLGTSHSNPMLSPTKQTKRYYTQLYAGDFLGEQKPSLGGSFNGIYYEIFDYDEFSHSVEKPSVVAPSDLDDNYVLVLFIQTNSSYSDIGAKDYVGSENKITIEKHFQNIGGTDDEVIKCLYLLIPKSVPSSYESTGDRYGKIKIERNRIGQGYSYVKREATFDIAEENAWLFDSLSALNKFLDSKDIEGVSINDFHFYDETTDSSYTLNSLQDYKILAVAVKYDTEIKCYRREKSAFLGFKEVSAVDGEITLTLERNIVNGDYGKDDAYIYFIPVPREDLSDVGEKPTVFLEVNDYSTEIIYP